MIVTSQSCEPHLPVKPGLVRQHEPRHDNDTDHDDVMSAPGGPAGVARLVSEVVFSPGPLQGVRPLQDNLRSAPDAGHAPATCDVKC